MAWFNWFKRGKTGPQNSPPDQNSRPPVFDLRGVYKQVEDGNKQPRDILRDITFTIEPSERLAIVGPSGAGKSTLLHLIGGMDEMTKGDIFFNFDQKQENLKSHKQLTKFRQQVGFVFQFFHLFDHLSVFENVALPLRIAGEKKVKEAVIRALKDVELSLKSHPKKTFPKTLSGGEKQRVAIARAIVREPKIILADEPTGSLDERNADNILRLLLEINRIKKIPLLIVTHNLEIAKERCHNVIVMRDGRMWSPKLPAHQLSQFLAEMSKQPNPHHEQSNAPKLSRPRATD